MKSFLNTAIHLALTAALAAPMAWAAPPVALGGPIGELEQGLATETAARLTEDAKLQQQIEAIELAPGPRGDPGQPGADGTSCSEIPIPGGGGTTIQCDETSAAIQDGAPGDTGANCRVTQEIDGATLQCGDTLAALLDGPHGQDGTDGQAGLKGPQGDTGPAGPDAVDRTADLCALYVALDDNGHLGGLTVPDYCLP